MMVLVVVGCNCSNQESISAFVEIIPRGVVAALRWKLSSLLCQDDVPGLQVRLHGEWFDVPPRKGMFICNLGDMLQRW